MSNLGFIPSWQFSLDAKTNPALNPFVKYPDGMHQTTTQPVGPYYNTGAQLAGSLDFGLNPTWGKVLGVLGVVGGVLGAYHGYKRNNESISRAIGWSVFGSFLPLFAIPIAVAQGIGKPKK